MSPVPATVTRQALTATLGAVAGVGLGLGALALVRAGQAEERDDAGTRAAFAKFLSEGPRSGTWRFETRDQKHTWLVQNDPSKPGMALVTDVDSTFKVPQQVRMDAIVRRLVAGDSDLFQRSYVPAGPALVQGGEIAISYRRRDCTACARRTIYFDAASKDLTRVEDRDYLGDVVQTASLVRRDDAAAGAAAHTAARQSARPPTPSPADFRRWASEQTIPVYEPTRLPAGFELVACRTLEIDRKDGSVRLRPLAITYDEGVARMVILIASRKDMEELDAVARELQKAGPTTCPSTPQEGPVDVVGPHIQRRKDACRTTLRREDLKDVVVILVGFNEIPDHLYVETMQSLVLVPK